MLDIFHQYAVDPKLEQEGKEFDMGGGVKMLIARSNNPRYQKMLNKLYEAHKHTLEQKETAEDLAEAKRRSNLILAEVMAHTVLLGWTGPVAFKGEILPYSVSNAKRLLEVEQFQLEVTKRADDFKNFRFEIEEADAKNSVITSGGTTPGAASLTSSAS